MRGRYLGAFTLLLGVLGVYSDTQRILWGQCYSNCLTLHSDEISQIPDDKHQSPSLIRTCRKVRDCKTCLFACDRSPINYTSIDSCLHDCDVVYPNYESCRQSCRFLTTAAAAKVGTCPNKESMFGFQVACVDQCRYDADCSSNKKCCDNGCGFTCMRPRNHKSLPKKPEDVSFDTRKDGGIVISWNMPKGSWLKDAVKPFVYVIRWRIQARTSVGHNYEVTDRMYLKLRGIVPASTLHVIVAAVNVYGSRGFTTVYSHIKEFIKPSPPASFEEGTTTLHNNKVDVELLWQPPRQTEGLSVNRYVLQRSEGLPQSSPVYHRVNMHKYRVPKEKHKFTLKNLEQGTRYFVQVYATVQWQGKVHKGRMASMYIVTYSPPTQASSEDHTPRPWTSHAMESSPIYNITVDQSIYNSEGVLRARIQWRTVTEERLSKYMVYWRASQCDKRGRRNLHPAVLSATSHDQEFHVYNLHYSCNYTVKIIPVNEFEDILAGSIASFTTPHCIDITVQGDIRPDCPKKVSSIPGYPRNIQVHWLIDRCSIDAAIVWDHPLSTQQITNYSIQWGQSQEVPASSRQVVYNKQPHDLIISGNSTELILPSLQADRHYTVQISALSSSGEGDKAVQHFRTKRRECTRPTTTQQSLHTESTTPVSNTETKEKPVAIICVAVDASTVQSSRPRCSGSRVLAGWGFILSLILSIVLL